jgi:hypothetical protein
MSGVRTGPGVLFGAEPVAIVSVSDWSQLPVALAAFGVHSIAWDGTGRRLLFAQGEASLSDLPDPPTCPCVLVAAQESSAADLLTLQAHWNGTAVPLVRLSEQDEAQVSLPGAAMAALQAVMQSVRDRYRSLAEHEASLLAQIVSLRQEVEHQRQLLAEMRQALTSQPIALTTVVEPDGSSWQSDSAEFVIPTSIWGLAQIDLYFTGGGGAGRVAVRLEATATGEKAGEWEIPFQSIVQGWNALSFPTPVQIREYRMRLTVRWSTDAPPAPALSMSGVVALPSGEAYVDKPVEQVRLPAMRIYRSPVGRAESPVPHWK